MMNPFRKVYEKIRDKVFGRAPTVNPWGRQRTINRQDQGPADAKYLRRLFPNSIFTKKFTHARQKTVRDVMRRLRPDQRAIVRARGWNRGIEA